MRRLILTVSAACGLTTSACASRPSLPAAPRLEMPPQARRPCELHRLPAAPTISDLEVGYAQRGAQIVACDAARRLAVETHDAEHRTEDEAQRAPKR